MRRSCDGTDPNLTREIDAGEYDPGRHTISPWDAAKPSGSCYLVINDDCGRVFDDVDRSVLHPHPALAGSTLRA